MNLEKYLKYMIYLPKENEKKFRIFIVEVSEAGGVLGDLVETIYPNAEVYWMNTPEEYSDAYNGMADYLLFFDDICRQKEILSFFRKWQQSLKNDGIMIFNFDEVKEKYHYGNVEQTLYLCNMALQRYDNNGLFQASKNMSEKKAGTLLSCYSRVYVVCPAFHKTGGPEVAHQLVYAINSLGGEAFIAYGNTEYIDIWTNMEFYKYVRGHVTQIKEIPDERECLVIVPEGWADCVFTFQKAKVFLWWLSVDNLTSVEGGMENRELVKRIDEKAELHIVQSEYAADYLTKNGVKNFKIRHLADYLNDVYLKTVFDKESKDSIVAYNPKKGAEFTQKLINQSDGAIKYVPIQNMTTEEVKELLLRAKVYIDFGNHPGKDRIPREAAILGCIVITGKRGSAAFKEDVFIPERFKFDDAEESIPHVIDMIREVMENYDSLIYEFDEYRERIKNEKEQFIGDIRKIFFEDD